MRQSMDIVNRTTKICYSEDTESSMNEVVFKLELEVVKLTEMLPEIGSRPDYDQIFANISILCDVLRAKEEDLLATSRKLLLSENRVCELSSMLQSELEDHQGVIKAKELELSVLKKMGEDSYRCLTETICESERNHIDVISKNKARNLHALQLATSLATEDKQRLESENLLLLNSLHALTESSNIRDKSFSLLQLKLDSVEESLQASCKEKQEMLESEISRLDDLHVCSSELVFANLQIQKLHEDIAQTKTRFEDQISSANLNHAFQIDNLSAGFATEKSRYQGEILDLKCQLDTLRKMIEFLKTKIVGFSEVRELIFVQGPRIDILGIQAEKENVPTLKKDPNLTVVMCLHFCQESNTIAQECNLIHLEEQLELEKQKSEVLSLDLFFQIELQRVNRDFFENSKIDFLDRISFQAERISVLQTALEETRQVEENRVSELLDEIERLKSSGTEQEFSEKIKVEKERRKTNDLEAKIESILLQQEGMLMHANQCECLLQREYDAMLRNCQKETELLHSREKKLIEEIAHHETKIKTITQDLASMELAKHAALNAVETSRIDAMRAESRNVTERRKLSENFTRKMDKLNDQIAVVLVESEQLRSELCIAQHAEAELKRELEAFGDFKSVIALRDEKIAEKDAEIRQMESKLLRSGLDINSAQSEFSDLLRIKEEGFALVVAELAAVTKKLQKYEHELLP